MRAVVTGAGGWLAREVIDRLAEAGAEVVGVSGSGAGAVGNREFEEGFDCSGWTVVHCAFCRGSDGPGLVGSLDWSRRVFSKAAREGAAGVVYASSQAVYGSRGGMGSAEGSPLSPEYPYALAKAAGEVLLEACAAPSGTPRTSLRLASLMGVSGGRAPDNVLGKFVDAALGGRDLTVRGGAQRFSFLDVRDAAGAVEALLARPAGLWRPAYNVTPDAQVGIVEMARLVAGRVALLTGRSPVRVLVVEGGEENDPGGSNALIREDTGWKPTRDFERIVDDTVRLRLGEGWE